MWPGTPARWGVPGHIRPWALSDPDHLSAGGAQVRPYAARRGDAAVRDVDRTTGPGGESGREEQLANTEVGAVAVCADADHVAGRVGLRALVEPVNLELGGVEGAVAAEPAALYGRQARCPDLRCMSGNDPPDPRVARRVEAPEQFPYIQCAAGAAGNAGRHRVALPALGHRDEGAVLHRPAPLDLDQEVGARVHHVAVAAGVEHAVGVGVGEVVGRQLLVVLGPGPVLVADVGDAAK